MASARASTRSSPSRCRACAAAAAFCLSARTASAWLSAASRRLRWLASTAVGLATGRMPGGAGHDGQNRGHGSFRPLLARAAPPISPRYHPPMERCWCRQCWGNVSFSRSTCSRHARLNGLLTHDEILGSLEQASCNSTAVSLLHADHRRRRRRRPAGAAPTTARQTSLVLLPHSVHRSGCSVRERRSRGTGWIWMIQGARGRKAARAPGAWRWRRRRRRRQRRGGEQPGGQRGQQIRGQRAAYGRYAAPCRHWRWPSLCATAVPCRPASCMHDCECARPPGSATPTQCRPSARPPAVPGHRLMLQRPDCAHVQVAPRRLGRAGDCAGFGSRARVINRRTSAQPWDGSLVLPAAASEAAGFEVPGARAKAAVRTGSVLACWWRRPLRAAWARTNCGASPPCATCTGSCCTLTP